MKIRAAYGNETSGIFTILRDCKNSLHVQGIFQWMDSYPTLSIVEDDIAKGYLYCAVLDDQCIGIVAINDEQEQEYTTVTWGDTTGKPLVIHRLAVSPGYQGRGVARVLMDFAEGYGRNNGYSSVRLDAYSGNMRVLQFYENRGYKKCGEVFFPGRELPFFCYEKII